MDYNLMGNQVMESNYSADHLLGNAMDICPVQSNPYRTHCTSEVTKYLGGNHRADHILGNAMDICPVQSISDIL